jgi:lysophospholipase L1-like esterase
MILLGLYGLAVHAVLAASLVYGNLVERIEYKLGIIDHTELDQIYRHWSSAFARADLRARPDALLFVGDSMMRDLDTSSIARHTLNLAIPGDTTVGVLKRLGRYRSLLTARGIVLGIGLNDLMYRSVPEALANFEQILTILPEVKPVIVIAVLPVDERATTLFNNKNIRELNEGMASLCAARERCIFVEPSALLRDGQGNLIASAHNGDGIHLSAVGHDLYWQAINDAVVANVPPPVLTPPER